MAENETSVSGDVVWQDGDDLSETNLTRTAAKSNLTDYVERGMGFAVDHAADTVDIGSGHVIIQDGVNAYDVFPNQQTDISLPNTSAVNYVYVAHQPGTDDDVYYHIDDDDTAPADPSLKIGTIDTANDTADDTINRNPVGNFRTVSINGTTVLESDGVIATGALPDLAITQTDVVADESERLALDAEEGDIAIQQDVDESYIFTGGDPSVDSNWSEIVTSPAQHANSHEKGGSDELTTFGDTVHDSVSTENTVITEGLALDVADDSPHIVRGLTGAASPSLIPDGEADNPIAHYQQPSISGATTIDFVADPFLAYDGSQYHLVAEVAYNDGTSQEVIGHWTSVAGKEFAWDDVIVSDGDVHFAYPFVWQQGGTWYMTPNEGSPGDFTVWTASSVGGTWSKQETAIGTDDLVDPTPIYHDPTVHNWGGSEARWFVIVDAPSAGEVRLYYSDAGEGDILGRTWTEHPDSPIDDRTNYHGPGGRPIVASNQVSVFYQSAESGEGVDITTVDTLTDSAFSQSEHGYYNPILQPTKNDQGWRNKPSHHIDIFSGGPTSDPIAVADFQAGSNSSYASNNRSIDYCVGLFTLSPRKKHSNITLSSSFDESSSRLVPYDTVQYDFGGDYDTTNNHYTALYPGYYKVEAQLGFNANGATGARAELTVKNKDTGKSAKGRSLIEDDFGTVGASGEFYAEFGQKFEAEIAVGGTSTNVTFRSGDEESWFRVRRTGP